MADIDNPDSFVCACRTWIYLDITRFYEEQYHQMLSQLSSIQCVLRMLIDFFFFIFFFIIIVYNIIINAVFLVV